MDTLNGIVRTAMTAYARKGLNSHSYLTHSDDNSILSVVTVPVGKGSSFTSLLVRIFAETIIIERDQNDKPLVDALVQAGIPRSQIILAYAGESVPQSA
ncbi:MAG: XisI protein [Anaerolineae bacterium]|nr:XisI protein [Anaerolineae bacterium]